MKRGSVKILSLILCLAFAFPLSVAAQPPQQEQNTGAELPCNAAILMDAKTGTVLFEQNADQALPPASVTKIMTLLLVMEAIKSQRISLRDDVTVSANAASMGGSQVYLKEGECMSVEEMLKCVVIASANDCAVALAEFVAGSEEEFVAAMNKRAAELGMKNTHFENTNGLDDTVTAHLTSARDIAIMSRELIRYPKILEYSGIWMDSIRDGSFGLTNTNRLMRFYPGCTGLKTGSTSRAGFCISATAERGGVSLICVIMGADTRDVRNQTAAKLLDFGFANFSTYCGEAGKQSVRVTGGVSPTVNVSWQGAAVTVPKGQEASVVCEVELAEALAAPIERGARVGVVRYLLDGKEIAASDIVAEESVEKIEFSTLFWRLLCRFLLVG